MADTSIWVHGISAMVSDSLYFPEYPGPAAVVHVKRDPAGAEFSPNLNTTVDFRVPIPSPTVLAGKITRLTSVTVLYAASDATIDAVQIYDGQALLQDFPNLQWTGQHVTFDATNRLLPTPVRRLTSGLLVVLRVTFNQLKQPTAERTNGLVRFVAVGATMVDSGGFFLRFIRGLGFPNP